MNIEEPEYEKLGRQQSSNSMGVTHMVKDSSHAGVRTGWLGFTLYSAWFFVIKPGKLPHWASVASGRALS